jgi:hypothetical protein
VAVVLVVASLFLVLLGALSGMALSDGGGGGDGGWHEEGHGHDHWDDDWDD